MGTAPSRNLRIARAAYVKHFPYADTTTIEGAMPVPSEKEE